MISAEEGVCRAIAERTGQDGTALYLEGLKPFEEEPHRGEPWQSFENWLDARGYREEWEAAEFEEMNAIIDRWNAESEQPGLFAEVGA